MWINNESCKLCLICSRSKDLINLKKAENLDQLLIELAKIIKITKSRSQAFAQSFNIVKNIIGSSDPYKETKKILNEIGRKLAETVEVYLKNVNWNIYEAIRISAAANIVDTSVLGYEPKKMDESIWDKPAIEEYYEIPRNKAIYVVLDNAGEAVIDFLMIRALKFNGYKVAVVIREESYEIDILRNDLNFENDIEIIETPGNLPPIFYIDSGFVIAKGIANAEAYLENENENLHTLHLLRAKCDVIASAFNVAKNSVLVVSGKTIKKTLNGIKSFTKS